MSDISNGPMLVRLGKEEERKRCVKIAKKMKLGPAEEADDDLVRGYTHGFNAACREIAAAILKGRY